MLSVDFYFYPCTGLTVLFSLSCASRRCSTELSWFNSCTFSQRTECDGSFSGGHSVFSVSWKESSSPLNPGGAGAGQKRWNSTRGWIVSLHGEGTQWIRHRWIWHNVRTIFLYQLDCSWNVKWAPCGSSQRKEKKRKKKQVSPQVSVIPWSYITTSTALIESVWELFPST